MESAQAPLKETYLIATTSGDQRYLGWLWDRLTMVYHESENVDFVHTLANYRKYFERRSDVPYWLNWLLRKYDL